jgi:hypothetical protein
MDGITDEFADVLRKDIEGVDEDVIFIYIAKEIADTERIEFIRRGGLCRIYYGLLVS